MSVAELRGKNKVELNFQCVELQKELFNIRFQRVAGQVENTARIREIRREIARIKTLVTQASKVDKTKILKKSSKV